MAITKQHIINALADGIAYAYGEGTSTTPEAAARHPAFAAIRAILYLDLGYSSAATREEIDAEILRTHGPRAIEYITRARTATIDLIDSEAAQ